MEVMSTLQDYDVSQFIQIPDLVKSRKATPKDLSDIYKVACSVGSNSKESSAGFLMDDYKSRPKYYQKFFLERIFELDYFYVAESNIGIVGFLMAYTKEQWLKYNPTWIEDIMWRPDFSMEKTSDFVIVDKTAIMANLTGKGIGSTLYKALLKDLKKKNIKHIFAETLVDPVPNFASLAFRQKQKYTLAGTRYENYMDTLYTDLIYYKPVN